MNSESTSGAERNREVLHQRQIHLSEVFLPLLHISRQLSQKITRRIRVNQVFNSIDCSLGGVKAIGRAVSQAVASINRPHELLSPGRHDELRLHKVGLIVKPEHRKRG